MTHAAYIYDIQHVVIDNLQFMLGSSVRYVYCCAPDVGKLNIAIYALSSFLVYKYQAWLEVRLYTLNNYCG